MSEPLRILALLGPVALATLISSIAARGLVRRAGLGPTMVAIALVASLVTVLDVLVLNHFMLLDPGNRAEILSVALYSLTAGVAAALIVGRNTTDAIGRLVGMARAIGRNDLEARVGELRAGPDLQLLADALDQAAARLDAALALERQTESERRDLMTSISHDLRTPLASLRSMAEAISDGVVDDAETVRRYTTEMLRSIMSLVELVDDLFELAQTDIARLADEEPLIPLADAVRQAVDLCGADAAAKAVRLDVELGPAGARACSPRLARVIHSLVDNAVRHTPAGGLVSVRAAATPAGIQVSVEDTGDGIPADDLDRVFEPFWRGDPARSGRGSGLGLTLAKRIVEALGGHIEATSSQAGARFQISVPTRA